MHNIPTEILAILGIGVVGFIGSTILVQMGQKIIAISLDIILGITAAWIALDYIFSTIGRVARVFHINI